MLIPALEGTRQILRAAQKVRRRLCLLRRALVSYESLRAVRIR